MATLSEHAEAIKAAIRAAENDGYELDIDITTVYYSGEVEYVDIDLRDGANYVTIRSEDRTE